MAKQVINLGAEPTGMGGDTPRSAWVKAKANFTELYNWISGVTQDDDSPTALPKSLPLDKGGTGRTDGRLSSLETKVSSPPALYGTQGMSLGWNEAGSGEGNFVNNRGNGRGGFTWHSVNASNTASGPKMTYTYAGDLNVPGSFTVTQMVYARGFWCRKGINGTNGGNSYNFFWSGSVLEAYVDATRIGSVSLFTSDYRIKKNIQNLEVSSFLDRVDAYRIVTFQKRVFGGVFHGDGTTYQGLIAHEVQAINPLAVSGEKDGTDDQGNPVIQQLEPIALITDLMGAVKELRAELASLRADHEVLRQRQ